MRMPEDQTAVPTGAGEAEPTPALVPAATSAPNVPAIAAFGAPGAGVLPAPDAAADGEQDEPETPDPLAEDPAFAAWPAEVRSAWAELELPSLHDLLLAQERLAAEVRRQNQELRRLSQAVAAPAAPPPSDSDALARSLAAAHHLGERLAAAAAAGLIALAESARLVRDKARQTLADAGMTRVAPQAGESFDPETQRCLGTAPGQPGRIVRCERDGWRSGATLLRPADVIIGAAGAALPSQDTHP